MSPRYQIRSMSIFIIPGSWHPAFTFDLLVSALKDTHKLEAFATTLPTTALPPSGSPPKTFADDVAHIRQILVPRIEAGEEFVVVRALLYRIIISTHRTMLDLSQLWWYSGVRGPVWFGTSAEEECGQIGWREAHCIHGIVHATRRSQTPRGFRGSRLCSLVGCQRGHSWIWTIKGRLTR